MVKTFHSNKKCSILKNLQTENSLKNALRRVLLMFMGFDYFSDFDLFVLSVLK